VQQAWRSSADRRRMVSSATGCPAHHFDSHGPRDQRRNQTSGGKYLPNVLKGLSPFSSFYLNIGLISKNVIKSGL